MNVLSKMFQIAGRTCSLVIIITTNNYIMYEINGHSKNIENSLNNKILNVVLW